MAGYIVLVQTGGGIALETALVATGLTAMLTCAAIAENGVTVAGQMAAQWFANWSANWSDRIAAIVAVRKPDADGRYVALIQDTDDVTTVVSRRK